MKYFVFRNQTVEPFLGDKDIAYSGYGDIGYVPEDACRYIWFYQVPFNINAEQLATEIGDYINMLKLVVSQINENKDVLVFTLVNLFRCRLVGDSMSVDVAVNQFNSDLRQLSKMHKNIHLIDFSDFTEQFPADQLVNWKFYLISQTQLSTKLAKNFSEWFSNIERELELKRKKCLVLDLDNTLWGGILGEDGIEGVKIGGDYPGKAFLYWQQGLLELSKTGVILTICSKNNEQDVEELWKRNPFMALRKEHFSAWRINWNDKASNIQDLAKELNIGLDSMVFLDDNPAERLLVSQALPMVTVPEFPSKPYELMPFFKQLVTTYFRVYTITDEDRQKTAQYKANAQRAAARSQFVDMEAYLGSLDMRIDIFVGIGECIETLQAIKDKTEITDNPVSVYEFASALRDSMISAIDCTPVPDTITNINEEKSGLSMTSKLKVTLEKLRKARENLSDKERTISKTIDVSMDNLQKNAERALISNNREAVIKGTIIPSASKCIKAALITGAAWALSPALAVIGLLGAIGASKKLQKRERQLIIDDIDIELNMCERYMKMAEDKNDLQAQKHILQTQRELQRQKQRLQYNMQVKFREKTPPNASLGNKPGLEENFNLTEEDIIMERSGLKKELKKDADKISRDAQRTFHTSNDVESILKSHKGEIKVGKIKIKNPKLSKEDMLERPDKVREYLKEEGQDPYINIGNAIGLLDFLFTIGITVVSSSLAEYILIMLCKRMVKNILALIKLTANAADPNVKVAVKTTRDSLLKYIHKLDVEIKLEKDPKKRAQLEKDREVLLSCYNETKVENKIEKKVI